MAKFIGMTKSAEDFVSRFNQVEKREEDNVVLRSWKTADGLVKEVVQPTKSDRVFTCLEVPSGEEAYYVFEWSKRDNIPKSYNKSLGVYK